MSIRFEALQFRCAQKGKPLFSGFSAEFKREKITVLTGASGCGKSSLLYLAAGIYPRHAGILSGGRITVEGVDPGPMSPKNRCRLTGMMFQNPALQFCMDTVENELIFCLENICVPPDAMEAAMDQALDFCRIRHLKKRTLLSLSGGERQKVMLACLTALRPKWLLLDEPFANIASRSARAIAEKLKELHREYGMGILAVDHRLEHWLAAADEVRILEDGVLLPEAVDPSDPDLLESRGIIVPGHSYRPKLLPPKAGEVVLELKNMSLSHGKTEVLKNINASFRRGLIYAVTGESGCGKSSLFGALSGLYKYRGSVLLRGKELRKTRKKQIGQMGFVAQNPQDQFVGGTVRQEILAGLRGKAGAMERSEEILRKIRLWRYRDVSPYLLSQGQQRRLGTASLTACGGCLFVCDEPAYAQDRRSTMAIMEALCRQAREGSAALIFSTHDLQLAKDYADELWKLEGGTLHALDRSRL